MGVCVLGLTFKKTYFSPSTVVIKIDNELKKWFLKGNVKSKKALKTLKTSIAIIKIIKYVKIYRI